MERSILFQEGGLLSASYNLVPISADDRFMKGQSMCYHVYMILHVKDPLLSVVGVGHRVPLAGFCLSLYSLHVLNRDVNMIQTNYQLVRSCSSDTLHYIALVTMFIMYYTHLAD